MGWIILDGMSIR